MDSIWTNGSWQVVTTSNYFLFHYFILPVSLSLVLSYSSNGTKFLSVSSTIYLQGSKRGPSCSDVPGPCTHRPSHPGSWFRPKHQTNDHPIYICSTSVAHYGWGGLIGAYHGGVFFLSPWSSGLTAPKEDKKEGLSSPTWDDVSKWWYQ